MKCLRAEAAVAATARDKALKAKVDTKKFAQEVTYSKVKLAAELQKSKD